MGHRARAKYPSSTFHGTSPGTTALEYTGIIGGAEKSKLNIYYFIENTVL